MVLMCGGQRGGGGAARKGMPNCAQSLADHLH